MSDPRVTVLLPVFNGERFIREAVESIIAQTFTDFELLVVDDGSTDRTPKILDSFRDPRIRIHRNPSNLKLIASLNLGISLARGELIARMDADDIAMPMRLERQVDFLDRHPEVDVVGADIAVFEEVPIRSSRLMPPPTTPGQIHWELLRVSCIYHPTVMMRKRIFDSAKAYDPSFIHSEDYELWLRLARTRQLRNIAEPLVYYRRHDESVSRKHGPAQREHAERALAMEIERRIGLRPSRSVTGPLMEPTSIRTQSSIDEFRKVFPLLLFESLAQQELDAADRKYIELSALATVGRVLLQAARHKPGFLVTLLGTIVDAKFTPSTYLRFPLYLVKMLKLKLLSKP